MANYLSVWYFEHGEDTNVCTEFGSTPQPFPEGYQWDYCSPNALIGQIKCNNGEIVSKSGTSYKVIWMDRNFEYVSVPVLRKLARLAKNGAWIGGPKPVASPSLADDMEEWNTLVGKIWGGKYPNVVVSDSVTPCCINTSSIRSRSVVRTPYFS